MYRIDSRQASDSFADARAARRFARLVEQIGGQAARGSLDAHTSAGHDMPTLAVWLEHYLAHLTGATDGTIAEYRRTAARTWLPTLGHLPLDAIDADTVKAWVGRQKRVVTVRGTPTSAKTIANAHSLLSQALAAAVEKGHLTTNQARGVTLPSGVREEMVCLTHAEFARLIHATPDHWRPLVATLAGTGVRWGEATALRWSDLDLDADVPQVTITRAWKRGPTTRELGAPKTTKARRRVSLPAEVVDALRPHLGAADDFVFTGPRGGHVHHQAFHPRVWRPAIAASGIGKRPRIHDLRHSHASWLIAAGVPLNVVQRRLGHESITTTVDTYGHLMGDAQTIAANAASLALSAAMPKVLD